MLTYQHLPSGQTRGRSVETMLAAPGTRSSHSHSAPAMSQSLPAAMESALISTRGAITSMTAKINQMKGTARE